MSPQLSIVVPLFNGATFVNATLDSLQAQRDVTTEIIVIDDGSSDEGPRLVEEHGCKARLIRQENAGVAVARNRGLAESTSPWVAFIDQDDLWHPDRSRVLLDLAEVTGRKMVATTELPFALESDREALHGIGDGRELWPECWVGEGGELEALVRHHANSARIDTDIEIIDHEELLAAPVSLTTAFMFDRASAISAGGCATFVRALDDHVFYVNLSRLVGGAARVGNPLLFYRVHSGSTTVSSPLVAPYLSTSLAMRWGRVLPDSTPTSGYLDHLIGEIPATSLSRVEQLALLTLSVPRGRRVHYCYRWFRRSVKNAISARPAHR